MKFVKETEQSVNVTYSSFYLKWMISGSLIMVAGSLYLVLSFLDVGIIRGFFNGLIGLGGLLFFGGILLRVITIALGNSVLFQITPNGFVNRKGKEIPFADIQNISVEFHSGRATGMIFKDIVLSTNKKSLFSNKRFYICTYNLLDERQIGEVLKKYVLHNVSESCRQSYLKQEPMQDNSDQKPNMPM